MRSEKVIRKYLDDLKKRALYKIPLVQPSHDPSVACDQANILGQVKALEWIIGWHNL